MLLKSMKHLATARPGADIWLKSVGCVCGEVMGCGLSQTQV